MFNEIIKTTQWNGSVLEMSTGKIARQATGSVVVKMGSSVVLCTSVSAKVAKEGIDFFPLTVNYREMSYAVGKIPGGFLKREGKSTEREVLVSRLIDRPIRPLFHSGFFNDTQVLCTVLSYDPVHNTDILSIIGASAALAISGVPYLDIVAASRVGFIDGNFVLNPSMDQLEKSKLDLVVAGTDSSVMMVESEASLLTEEQMLNAVKFGHAGFQPVIKLINDLVAAAGKPKWEVMELYPSQLKNHIHQMAASEITDAFAKRQKQERYGALDVVSQKVLDKFTSEGHYSNLQVSSALADVKSEILRSITLGSKFRIDGRKPEDIRQIQCEVSLLPKTHGSALFTRGETQALATTTLGTGQDEQMVDGLNKEYKERFMLNYIFPPYSVGEAEALRAPGRREIGHGKLAWRALNPVLPAKVNFPYSIRVVSEITECNGSSSMATVCSSSMAMMDAGVPLLAPVAGIAMGLIKEGNDFLVLSDIIADEDHLGDMDFKVAGTLDGVTALQMDIKVTGITFEIMQKALAQAKHGRQHILEQMTKAISTTGAMNDNAPAIVSLTINKDKIRDIIGPGGKVIREICETTGAKIDINDDGVVSVSAVGKEKIDAAIARIKEIAFDPEIGDVYEGTVVKIMEAGAFVNYLGSRDGFVHIREMAHERINAVSDVLKEGQKVKVKILGFERGKAKLTIKNADNASDPSKPSEPKAEKKTVEVTSELAEPSNKRDGGAKKWKGSSNASTKKDSETEEDTRERKYFN